MKSLLTIDGSFGEGGGQILRTALALAIILNQPVHLKNIRANRKNPGLAAQHLTAVRAGALICEATVTGDTLRSTELVFSPRRLPVEGVYAFDVAQAQENGSAGAATLVMQTILLPLALAAGPSEVTIRGGTHVAWSPPFHYIQDVFLPMLANLGPKAAISLSAWGWYPAGEGEIKIHIPGQAQLSQGSIDQFWPVRGPLRQIKGLAVASSLPAHIAQRIKDTATKLLMQADLPAQIVPSRVRSVSPGAGLFLSTEYEHCRAGFTVLGQIGKSSEQVAEEAVVALMAFHQSQAILDEHLADQLILPIALSGLSGSLSVQKLSSHAITNLWVIEQFLGPVATIDRPRNIITFSNRDRTLL